jgi:hypothetical protein
MAHFGHDGGKNMNILNKNRIGGSKTSATLSLGKSRYKKVSLYVFSAFLIVWLSGCSTVDPKPFTKFNTAASEITKVDASVDAHTSTVKESEMARIAQDSDEVKKLSLEFDVNDPFMYEFKFTRADEPLFIKWQRLDSGLTELNLAFIEHTRLLAALAGGDLIKTEDFDKLATDLNNNARSALKSLGKEPDGSKLALFSAAASTAAHAYISMKRKQSLIDIINKNQVSVEAYIKHAQEAVGILADDIKAEYQKANRSLLKQWASSSSARDKRTITDKIYSNSDITGKTLDMLKALDKTYMSLAVTHKELATGLENNQFSVSDLTANIQRVQKLYNDLKKANEEAEKTEKSAAQANQGE